jgi:hypothetical protein
MRDVNELAGLLYPGKSVIHTCSALAEWDMVGAIGCVSGQGLGDVVGAGKVDVESVRWAKHESACALKRGFPWSSA